MFYGCISFNQVIISVPSPKFVVTTLVVLIPPHIVLKIPGNHHIQRS
jgi:hypothetical protein